MDEIVSLSGIHSVLWTPPVNERYRRYCVGPPTQHPWTKWKRETETSQAMNASLVPPQKVSRFGANDEVRITNMARQPACSGQSE